jgi:hypothetical protein
MTELCLASNPEMVAYAEAVMHWARENNFRIRTGGDLCAAADVYDSGVPF